MEQHSLPLINIHTHTGPFDEHITILNVFPTDQIPVALPDNIYYSSGIHPWYTDDWEKQIENLSTLVEDKKLIAIGECGLDKTTSSPISLQQNIFYRQVELSEQYQKPMIIHCVKAFNELLQTRIKMKPEMTWIIHGFNSSLEIARQCQESGMMLSFGKPLLQNDAKAAKIIRNIPVSGIFLETDESEISISEIYNRYAHLSGMPMNELKAAILKNFREQFKTVNLLARL